MTHCTLLELIVSLTFRHILALHLTAEADLVPEQDDLEGVGVLCVGLPGDPGGDVQLLHQLVAACNSL